ncbi:MAG: hypothetical protein HC933_04160, partial [Pleurocapsa sp. SU_196_0]|nr:hypothetical protein [Pleurocapsa sp. SU_196_0]
MKRQYLIAAIVGVVVAGVVGFAQLRGTNAPGGDALWQTPNAKAFLETLGALRGECALEVGVGLAREADDDVGAHGEIRDRRPRLAQTVETTGPRCTRDASRRAPCRHRT